MRLSASQARFLSLAQRTDANLNIQKEALDNLNNKQLSQSKTNNEQTQSLSVSQARLLLLAQRTDANLNIQKEALDNLNNKQLSQSKTNNEQIQNQKPEVEKNPTMLTDSLEMLSTMNKNDAKIQENSDKVKVFDQDKTVEKYDIKIGENTFSSTNKGIYDDINSIEDDDEKLAKIIQLYRAELENFGLNDETAVKALDINGDGKVSIADVTMAQRNAMKRREALQKAEKTVDKFMETFSKSIVDSTTDLDVISNQIGEYDLSNPIDIVMYKETMSPYVDDIITYFDKNEDNISIDEFTNFVTPIFEKMSAGNYPIEINNDAQALFDMINQNNDGKLDKLEIMSMIAALDASSFSEYIVALDRNELELQSGIYKGIYLKKLTDIHVGEINKLNSGASEDKYVYAGGLDGTFGASSIMYGTSSLYSERTSELAKSLYNTLASVNKEDLTPKQLAIYNKKYEFKVEENEIGAPLEADIMDFNRKLDIYNYGKLTVKEKAALEDELYEKQESLIERKAVYDELKQKHLAELASM